MSQRRPSRTGQSPASFEPLEQRALMSAAVDLTIADAGFSDAANQPPPVPGAPFYIQPTFQENGQAPTDPLPFSIYLSPTPTLTDQSIRIYSRADGDFAAWSGPTWKADASGNLPSAVTPGTWYPIVVVDPNNTIPESDEFNNTLVADPVTVTLPHDDLIVPGGVSAPDAWPAGSTLQITGPYAGPDGHQYPVTYAFALSADDTPGNADDILLGTFTSQPTASWHPGGPVAYPMVIVDPAHAFTVPSSLPPGTYHLVTIVDPDNAIAEPNETNNSTLGPDITILPTGTIDLTACAPSIGPSPYASPEPPHPTDSTPGSQITIGAYPFSKFGQAARPKVAFVLSSDDTYGNGDDILLGSYDADATTPLPPGIVVCYAYPTTLDVTLPSTLAPGHYQLFAVVDPDNQIPEYDESNNVSPATDLTITQPAPAPTPVDLTVADTGFAPSAVDSPADPSGALVFIPLPPPPANPGAHFRIYPTFLENGLAPDRSLPYAIYLSPTPTLTDQSVFIYSGTTDQGATATGSPLWMANATGTLPPTITPGTWYPIVVVDPDNTISESDESNNVLVADPITVALPHDDLIPPTSSASATAVAGQPITIYSDFEPNNRQYPATIAYSLSSDNIAGNADDILLGTTTDPYFGGWYAGFFSVTNILHPAGWIGYPNTFTLPANLPPGTYHLVTTIDPDNAIAEPNETNNSLLGPTITVLPTNSPDQPSPSQPIQPPTASSPIFRNVTPRSTLRTPVTLTNPTGRRRTGQYKITFYLSTDDKLSRNDKPFSTQTLTTTLRPHQTRTRHLAYKLPPSARHGHRYVFATVTPIHPTRITAPSALSTRPLNILPKSPLLHSRSLSKQILDSD